MIEEGRTDFDLSITIPNTKSRSNMKYSANYVRLSSPYAKGVALAK